MAEPLDLNELERIALITRRSKSKSEVPGTIVLTTEEMLALIRELRAAREVVKWARKSDAALDAYDAAISGKKGADHD